MELKSLQQAFTVCKIHNLADVDLSRPFVFLSKTDEELSLVCETDFAPANTLAREDGWCAFRVQGVLDFSMVGVLSAISSLLADASISIFAVSTYNTDYIFIKSAEFDQALALLADAGYRVVS